jgi:hypothetical protein
MMLPVTNNLPELLSPDDTLIPQLQAEGSKEDAAGAAALFGDLLLNLVEPSLAPGMNPEAAGLPTVADAEGENSTVGLNLILNNTIWSEGDSLPADKLSSIITQLEGQATSKTEGGQLNNTLNTPTLDVPPGKYEVIDVTLKDGTVQLTVTGKHDGAKPVTITVPVEYLKGETGWESWQAVTSRLWHQEPKNQPAPDLTEYFEKLNLKEIEITSSGGIKPGKSDGGPVQTLVPAQQVGHLLAIRERFLRNNKLNSRLGETPIDSNIDSQNQSSGERINIPGQSFSSIDGGQVLLKGSAAAQQVTDGMVKFPLESQALSKEKVDEPEKNVRFHEPALFDMKSVNRDGRIDKTAPQPVRFTLPGNIKTALKPYGQAVTLLIEPEFLGPARLSLSMQHDRLRARVVVENHLAKAAVDASLDRLIEQLSRADIKVDHIEVTVDGANVSSGQFDRQPQWRRGSGTFTRGAFPKDMSVEKTGVAASLPTASGLYIGAGGVNYLA